MADQLYSKVNFFSDGVKLHLKNRTNLKSFIKKVFKKEKKELDIINFIFTTDNKLLEINRSFLKHDFLTDIITFELTPTTHPAIADVYISMERVRENAKKLKTGINYEVHRVIFHGALHLCGYKDKTKREIAQMRGKEDHYLIKYFS